MADATTEAADEAPKKKSKLPLLIGLVLMLLLGGGGFYAVYSGMILGPAAESDAHGDAAHAPEIVPDALPEIGFVALDPMLISLAGNGAKHLRFVAQLEVPLAYENDVAHLKPRVMDVLNGYLRAVDPALLEDPSALMRLRAQMLRRVQIVTGDGRVRDLLIVEFVLN
ncbi:flagellar basal body-associated protein FliL [Thioclava sp. 15-R06ZXC-3]|uniref:Flagellar protein FliL n=1 Tax=Thioclava arctica TaxID=3238301 RepID=A0ABV3TIU3_9RHOB